MNIAPVLFDALMPMVMFVFVIFFAVAGFKLYQPIMIGWFGERRIKGILESLDANQYIHFHDVLLPIDGETTQIDHVLMVGDTCFVIETKAHDGWIFGKANDKQWTQQFNKHSKFRFQNPIRQNHKHILAIKKFVGDMKVVGVVVFTRATLKSHRIDGVLYCKELKSFILKYKLDKTFDNKSSMQSLQKAMITDKAEHKAHVRRLQAKHGGRWRLPVANTFLVTALGLLIFRLGMQSSTLAVTAKPLPATPTFEQPAQIRNNPLPRAQTPTQTIKPQSQLTPPKVNGFVKGKVIIPNGKSFQVLRVGDQTRDGWKLEAAGATSAVFSHASGKTVKVSVKGVEHDG